MSLSFYDSLFAALFCVKSSECLGLFAGTSFLSFYYLLLHEVSQHYSFAAANMPSDVVFNFFPLLLTFMSR